MSTTNIAESIQEFTKRSLKPEVIEIVGPDGESIQVSTTPGGHLGSVKKLLDEYRLSPERITGTAQLHTLDAFIAHAKRFADDDSAVFADRNPSSPSLLAVYDYHHPATIDIDDESENSARVPGGARFAVHRARYGFPLADEWAAWIGANEKPMAQADFARFLEDRLADVIDPLGSLETTRRTMERLLCKFVAPAGLLDLARGLSVRVESIVANKQDLASGESTIRFETTHQDERGAPLQVPGAFLIAIPVFRGGARYELAARLRYRVKDGKITWWFSLYRQVETFDHAFGEACDRAAKETELPLYQGTPEA